MFLFTHLLQCASYSYLAVFHSACALAYGSAAPRAKTACGKVAQLRPKKKFARRGLSKALGQRRLERVVILRNDHMTIAHCAISVLQLPCTHGPRNAISYVYTLL